MDTGFFKVLRDRHPLIDDDLYKGKRILCTYYRGVINPTPWIRVEDIGEVCVAEEILLSEGIIDEQD